MQRIFAEEKAPRTPFWRRQFDPVPTYGQELFDGIFGVILPVLCFAADPIVFKGDFLHGPFFGEYQVLAYLTSAIEIAVFIAWRSLREHLTTFSAPLAGVLFAGGLFSTAIGVLILPLSVLGLMFLVGVLGFVPFLTAFVYFRSAVRAMKDQVRNSTYGYRYMTAALAGMLIVAMSVGGSIFLQPLLPRTEQANRAWGLTWDED